MTAPPLIIVASVAILFAFNPILGILGDAVAIGALMRAIHLGAWDRIVTRVALFLTIGVIALVALVAVFLIDYRFG